MVSAKDANNLISSNILGGAKVPHNTSSPVIYKENGKYIHSSSPPFIVRKRGLAQMI